MKTNMSVKIVRKVVRTGRSLAITMIAEDLKMETEKASEILTTNLKVEQNV
jgi:hypothetical protein